jgi:hypothetical protein
MNESLTQSYVDNPTPKPPKGGLIHALAFKAPFRGFFLGTIKYLP